MKDSRFREVETSYWKYLSVWEKDEWNKLKETYTWTPRSLDDIVEIRDGEPAEETRTLDGMDDATIVDTLVQNEEYNPLLDTRPYYHATYQDVRGTSQVYANLESSGGSTYLIDSSKGDEFPLTDYTKAKFDESGNLKDGNRLTFMDILNTKVAFRT